MTRKMSITHVSTAAICLIAVMFAGAGAQNVQRQDPRPYAPIAIQLPDTLDQLYRDSATIKIGRVRVNQAGYRPNDDKFFYYVGRSGFSGGGFSVIDANTGREAATGTLVSKNAAASGQLRIRASNNAALVSGGDTRYTMQSEVVAGPLYEGQISVSAQGRYRVRVGSDTSAPFWIHESVYSWVRDAAIKFPGVNRCGNTESWFHGACHLQDATQGGWHDCGDHLKEGITQSFLHSMLALGSAALRDHDVDNYGRNHNHTVTTDGVPDVLYEAKHGSDYVIAAYNNAGGDVSKMKLSVGGFGPDHMWWGQPEYQDRMPPARGGAPRPVPPNRNDEADNELGANIMGNFAAGLALTAKHYAVFDQKFADTSIAIAKKMYEFGKTNLVASQTPAYSGNGRFAEKMAFAAMALAWATGERKYLNELLYDKSIGTKASGTPEHWALFEGGWFTYDDPVFSKQTANTDWASPHMAVKWGLFRLILKDRAMCAALGIDSTERLRLMGKTIYNMIFDVTSASGNGTGSITMPNTGLWNRQELTYDPTWFTMHIQMNWMWNRYQFGNIFDLYCYSDMARYVQDSLVSRGIFLPGPTSWDGGQQGSAQVSDWKADETRRLMIRQLDYMLGVNLWDVSMIYGVGAKNHNHPHHRAANPEGRNVPGAFYRYRPPVGALHAGVNPTANAHYEQVDHYDDYHITETGIDASAVIIIPLMGLAKDEPISTPPEATVRTVYVGFDRAIIEVRQSRFGMTTIRYAEDGVTVTTSVSADSSGMFHRIELTGLKGATRYNFDALISDMFGNNNIVTDRDGELFTFVTLKEPVGDAEIANVKVCKVTADSAEIFWYTPNGAYDSKVVYGERKPVNESNGMVQDQNIYGRPTQFHYVKIGGLKEKTTYYFYVENNGVIDNNNGQFYEFTTPVEHVSFDVRVLKYSDQFFGLNIVNQDVKAYDSLELRIYLRAPDSVAAPIAVNGQITQGRRAFSDYVGMRVDIGIKYRSDGYQDTHFKTEIDSYVQRARPVRIEDTYNPADDTWGFYIPIPMGPAEMQSGARFRIDMMFDTRSPYSPYEDLMNDPPPANILDIIWNGWSFVPHSRANGDPVDYPGVPMGGKDDIDHLYHVTPINPYVTVYRKNEFVWGYSPSAREQQTKKTHYQMTSQIVAPIHNPSEEYLFMEQVMPSITVNGWAEVTDENGNPNGEINDIWVNGVRVRDVSSVAQYNFAADRWNLSIPVPVRNGGNNVDITIFGGPDPNCASCHGCAFTNHSFYVEFRGAEPYESTIKLLDCNNQSVEVRDSARVDETCFYIFVDDKNGNLNKDGRDTVWVSVVNPVIGDSISVALVETGDSTGNFRSANPIRIVGASPTQRGPNEISMDGGQVVWVTYVDITDPEDVSRVTLASRAEFAVPVAAWFKDGAGVGSIDQIYVRYNKIPDNLPDSLHLTIPGETAMRAVKAPGDNIASAPGDRSVVLFTLDPPIAGITGFRSGEQMIARSFLLYSNVVREAVVPVADSAGPALLDRAMLFEKIGSGGLDTLQVTLSEPMPGANIIGNSLVLRKSDGTDAALTVISVVDSSLLTNSLTLLVDPSGSRILEGDSVFINPVGPARDRAGNNAGNDLGYTRPVPVALKSAAPRFVSAFYRDADADGMIDTVELNLSKALNPTGLRLWLAWENGQFVPVDWSSLSFSESRMVVRAETEGLLTGDSIITSGRMRAMATHNDFPGDTLRVEVVDRAAPVIRWAQFAPGAENERDTLNVTFSEPLLAAPSRPFKFLSGEDGSVYEMVLQNTSSRAAVSHTFIVNAIENPAGYPTQNDSVRISVDVAIADTNATTQSNPDNRRVRLNIKPAPITIEVIPAPNPFVFGSWGSGGNRALIIVRPSSKVMTDLNLKGTISIYDRLGNLVMTDDLVVQADSPDLIYQWDGANKKGRRVGTGVYLITVSVEHVQEPWEEKIRPIQGRAKIYLKR